MVREVIALREPPTTLRKAAEITSLLILNNDLYSEIEVLRLAFDVGVDLLVMDGTRGACDGKTCGRMTGVYLAMHKESTEEIHRRKYSHSASSKGN